MPPRKRRASSAAKPLKTPKASKAPRPTKPPKPPQAWESYSQSFQATQYTHDSLAAEVVQPPEAPVAPVLVQPVVALSEDIQEEARPSTQVEDIEDEVGAIFEARGEAAEDKVDEVDEAKLPELSAEEVARMGLPTVPTTWEPMAAVPELDLKVVSLPKELIFAAQRASEPISNINAGVKSIDLSAQNKDTKHSTHCTLADQIGITSGGCKSK